MGKEYCRSHTIHFNHFDTVSRVESGGTQPAKSRTCSELANMKGLAVMMRRPKQSALSVLVAQDDQTSRWFVAFIGPQLEQRTFLPPTHLSGQSPATNFRAARPVCTLH